MNITFHKKKCPNDTILFLIEGFDDARPVRRLQCAFCHFLLQSIDTHTTITKDNLHIFRE